MVVFASLYRLLGSLKLCVVLVLLLALLTYLGTLVQVDKGLFEAQRLYFDSWLVLHPVRDVLVPLPGGHSVMALLFVNLIVGGFIRLRRTRRLVGVYVIHAGILLMLVAGFVKLYFSEDGYLQLWEGRTANFFESHYHAELAIARGGETASEVIVPEAVLQRAIDQRVKVECADLPFELTIDAYAQNAWPVLESSPQAPRDLDFADGVGLLRLANSREREHDRAGIYVTLRDKAGTERRQVLLGTTMDTPMPWSVTLDGQTWSLDLRRKRTAVPFKIRLEDFRKEDHPGTDSPRLFESDVVQVTERDTHKVKIEMNKPLRDAGFIFFQSGWGPQDDPDARPQYSVFAVVDNPSDKWPLISCVIIAVGLLLHFGLMLRRYIQRQGVLA